jgi:two-component system, OmpR family, response regulator
VTDPNGGEIDLTGGEFDLLAAFVRYPRRVLSRDQLLDWTRGRDAQPFDRAIDVQVGKLRRKLAAHAAGEGLIKTVRGGGYCLATTVERG